MPECPLGTENKTRIIGLEKAIDEIKGFVEDLRNHYSQRPTWLLAGVVVALSNLATGLIIYIVTH